LRFADEEVSEDDWTLADEDEDDSDEIYRQDILLLKLEWGTILKSPELHGTFVGYFAMF
jgi:hypothetical protein